MKYTLVVAKLIHIGRSNDLHKSMKTGKSINGINVTRV